MKGKEETFQSVQLRRLKIYERNKGFSKENKMRFCPEGLDQIFLENNIQEYIDKKLTQWFAVSYVFKVFSPRIKIYRYYIVCKFVE